MKKILIGKKIVSVLKTTSTNELAQSLIRNGKAEEGTVIVANHQSAGRGQRGKDWNSEKGKNLTLSIILKPDFLTPETLPNLNMMISIALADWLCSHLPKKWHKKIRIKWPNDIYFSDKKIAGILIENSWFGNKINYSIVGIGVNINQEKFPSELKNPVSLKQLIGKKLIPGDLVKGLLLLMDKRYGELKKARFSNTFSEYNNRLYRLMLKSWFLNENKKKKAAIKGVNPLGELVLELADGTIRSFKNQEIEML